MVVAPVPFHQIGACVAGLADELDKRRDRKMHDARVQAIMGEVMGTLAKVGNRLDQVSERSDDVQDALATAGLPASVR